MERDERIRYLRQMILPNIGEEGQQRLKDARILILGLGGLGSPAAYYLAGAGIGTLGLCDADRVELHNLHRQILHRTEQIGTAKTESSRQALQSLNPEVNLKLHPEGLHANNAIELIQNYDLVLDGSDNFPTRYLASDAACLTATPYIYGSIFQFEGQVSLFHPAQEGPSYRCLFPEMPEPGTVPNCAEAGVFGALCGVIGSLQAMEAIKWFTQTGTSLIGRLLTIDALTMKMREIKIKKDPQSPLIGENPTIKEIISENYEWSCESTTNNNMNTNHEDSSTPSEVSVNEAHQRLTQTNPPCLLDVREPHENEICSIKGSRLIPLGEVAERSQELPQDQPILVYCHHGMRSLKATELLINKGMKAQNIQGGIDAWAQELEPEMPRY